MLSQEPEPCLCLHDEIFFMKWSDFKLAGFLKIKLVWWWLISFFIWNSSISSNERRKWSYAKREFFTKNHSFHVQNLDFCQIIHLLIFFVWGQLIWDSNENKTKWLIFSKNLTPFNLWTKLEYLSNGSINWFFLWL